MKEYIRKQKINNTLSRLKTFAHTLLCEDDDAFIYSIQPDNHHLPFHSNETSID